MPKLFQPIAILTLSLCALPAFTQSPPDQLYTATRLQLDVTKVLLAQEAAWNRGDLDAYISHYKDAPDTQAILGTPVRGLQNIRLAFRANFPNNDAMGNLQQEAIDVRALGDDFALATGNYHLTRSRKAGGDLTGGFTEILEKTPTGWQVIFSEST
jgi:uncharacterized protein (TIGR02246 family)